MLREREQASESTHSPHKLLHEPPRPLPGEFSAQQRSISELRLLRQLFKLVQAHLSLLPGRCGEPKQAESLGVDLLSARVQRQLAHDDQFGRLGPQPE